MGWCFYSNIKVKNIRYFIIISFDFSELTFIIICIMEKSIIKINNILRHPFKEIINKSFLSLKSMRFFTKSFFLFIFILFFQFTFMSTVRLRGDISNYKPEVDISTGIYNFFFNPDDKLNDQPVPELYTGVYLGGYLNLQSPIFSFFFDTDKIHSIYEAGVALNSINGGSSLAFSIPLIVNLGYMVNITQRFGIIPLLGSGFIFIDLSREYTFSPIHYLLSTGLEIRYRLWDRTYLKLKADLGIIFVSELSSGYTYFLKVRLPLPFIP